MWNWSKVMSLLSLVEKCHHLKEDIIIKRKLKEWIIIKIMIILVTMSKIRLLYIRSIEQPEQETKTPIISIMIGLKSGWCES